MLTNRPTLHPLADTQAAAPAMLRWKPHRGIHYQVDRDSLLWRRPEQRSLREVRAAPGIQNVARPISPCAVCPWKCRAERAKCEFLDVALRGCRSCKGSSLATGKASEVPHRRPVFGCCALDGAGSRISCEARIHALVVPWGRLLRRCPGAPCWYLPGATSAAVERSSGVRWPSGNILVNFL
jgi:hypothetical protein